MAALNAADINELDNAIEQALIQRDDSRLNILGYGEISTVVAWRFGTQEYACKRLPLFPNEPRLNTYVDSVHTYLNLLKANGIMPVESTLHGISRADNKLAAYCVQPILAKETLLPHLLATGSAEDALHVFERVVVAIQGCVSKNLGIDGQLSNWAMVNNRLLYLDITTPMMRSQEGIEVLDADLFLASLPWALRALVRRYLLSSILGKYYDMRAIVVDILANLYKEGLEHLVPEFLQCANQLLQENITLKEVERYYAADARMWSMLQRLRQLDRFWQRHIRKRTYPFLLPGAIQR